MNAHANIELDDATLLSDEQQLYVRLGTLSPAQYAKEREGIAEELNINVTYLDLEWKERRKAKRGNASSDATGLFPNDEPWEFSVDGKGLLSTLKKRLQRHVVFVNDEQAVTAALWIAFAWTHEASTHSPMLLATSAEANCGKTTLLALVRFLTPRPLFTAEISPAALYRSIEKWKPTFVLDEADAIFTENEELRAVVNTGWTRGSGIIRCHPETNEPVMFPTFCPKAIGMKGKKLSDTTLSRCIILELKRKLADEDAQGFDHQDNSDLVALRRLCARWSQDHMDALKGAKPAMLDGFDNRLADNWRPSLAIADQVGGEWPELARKAAVKLSPLDQSSVGTMLLTDIRAMFKETGRDRLTSAEIVETLNDLEGRPWAEWGKSNKPISKNQVAGLLRPFKVAPSTIWVGVNKTAKGYALSAFEEPFDRYLAPISPSETSGRQDACGTSTSATSGNVRPEPDLTDEKCKKPLQHNGPDVLTDENPSARDERVCDHCGRAGGEFLQVAVPESPAGGVPVHRACVDAWFMSGTMPDIPDFLDRREA